MMLTAVRLLAALTFTIAAMAVSHTATSVRDNEVDLLLALAVDVSRSIDEQKFILQRDGYVAAITNPRVIDAIRSGARGRIAICYIEWSGPSSQKLLIDWTLIDDAASAHKFASQLAETPRAFADLTAIGSGIDFAVSQIHRAPFTASRKVIDVSGDGDDSNTGREVSDARNEAVIRGVTINALVVQADVMDGLKDYYRNNVIGGPRAFVMSATNYASFGKAMVSKLVAEIAGRPFSLASAEQAPKRASP